MSHIFKISINKKLLIFCIYHFKFIGNCKWIVFIGDFPGMPVNILNY